jgi:hypothetical protein
MEDEALYDVTLSDQSEKRGVTYMSGMSVPKMMVSMCYGTCMLAIQHGVPISTVVDSLLQAHDTLTKSVQS